MERTILPQLRPPTPHSDAENWADWRWQARNAARDLASLERALTLSDAERAGIERAENTGLPISITPYYLSLCDPLDPGCPIRQQCVPTAAEALQVEGDLVDPLGEEANEVAPRLVQRYPDRALLITTERCGVYCRFCTRSRIVGQGVGVAPKGELEAAFSYLRSHPEIQEVILSGGDPALLRSERIADIMSSLAAIRSVGNVRFATRTPVTLPQRIDRDFCAALREHPAVWLMTHFNHPTEITDASRQACATLVDAGIPVMNQSVLLRGINDSVETLEALFRALVTMRVRPYYLLQADPVVGTAHLRTPLRRGIELMDALQGRVSGIALPKLICDTPGGRGKVPLSSNVIEAEEAGRTTLRTFRGELVEYVDPPSN